MHTWQAHTQRAWLNAGPQGTNGASGEQGPLGEHRVCIHVCA
jgi:hypothetical protein